MFAPGTGAVWAGVADGAAAGKAIGLVAIAPGPLAFFSSHELRDAKQKTKAV